MAMNELGRTPSLKVDGRLLKGKEEGEGTQKGERVSCDVYEEILLFIFIYLIATGVRNLCLDLVLRDSLDNPCLGFLIVSLEIG